MKTYVLADDRLRLEFATTDPTSGERADADSTPVVTVYRNGVAVTAVDVIVNNLDTGLYEAVITLMEEYGLADRGAVYTASVAVTVGTKNGISPLSEWRIDPVKSYARAFIGQAAVGEGPGAPTKLAVVAPKYGPRYNGYQITFENDGSGVGSITGTAPTYVVHYEDGVTTVGNLITLIESVGLRAVQFDDTNTATGLDGVFDHYVTDGEIVELAGGADEESEYNMLASGRVAGATSSTMFLPTALDFGSNDILNHTKVTIVEGPGAGQSRLITDHVNGTDAVNIHPNWAVNPTSGSTFRLDRAAPTSADVIAWQSAVLFTPTVPGLPRVDVYSIEGTDATDVLDGIGGGDVNVISVDPTVLDDIAAAVDAELADGVHVASIETDAITGDAVAATALAEIGAAVWAVVLEGSNTAADMMRGIISGVMGPVEGFLSGVLVFKSLNGAKDRFTVTTSTNGRDDVAQGDLT